MSAVDASIVLLPRFTTLCTHGTKDFETVPLDVSNFDGAQLQVWRGPIGGGGTFTVYFEESLDGIDWVLGPTTPDGFVVGSNEQRFFSYDFRLRWFRLRVRLTGNGTIVTCWAEGLLRGGGGGMWPGPAVAAGTPVIGVPSVVPPAPGPRFLSGLSGTAPFGGSALSGPSAPQLLKPPAGLGP